MLHEILCSLLGFHGDVIVDIGSSYQVSQHFDLLTTGEREQINRIVPLGWFYVALSRFVETHEFQWGGNASEGGFQVYLAAFTLGIGEVLSEYANDIAILEQHVICETIVPLSYFYQHLQKYLFALPVLHSLCQDIGKKYIRGCQLLDYLSTYQSGNPIIIEVIQRILFRLRVVFLKQTLAWMIHGTLEDDGKEYFIQHKKYITHNITNGSETTNNIFHHTLQHLENALNIPLEKNMGNLHPFEWSSSYLLRLEYLPESHVSSRIASKILFAGKAVTLIQNTHSLTTTSTSNTPTNTTITKQGISTNENSNSSNIDYFDTTYILQYLSNSTSNPFITNNNNNNNNNDEGENIEIPPINQNKTHNQSLKTTTNQQQQMNSPNTFEYLLNIPTTTTTTTHKINKKGAEKLFEVHYASLGYSLQDISRFSHIYQEILNRPELTIELFENLVSDINTTISIKLCTLLRNQYNFDLYLSLFRNIYLIGKGELFQAILDHIIIIIKSNTYQVQQESVSQFSWDILRNTSKLLKLDFSALSKIISISVQSPQITVTDFRRDDAVILQGAALTRGIGVPGHNYSAVCVLCGGGGSSNSAGNDNHETDNSSSNVFNDVSSEGIKSVWHNHILRAKSALNHTLSSSSTYSIPHDNKNDSHSLLLPTTPLFDIGCLWLSDAKYIAKGFTLNTTFSLSGNWQNCASALLSSTWRQRSGGVVEEVTIGSFTCNLRSAGGSSGSSGGVTAGNTASTSIPVEWVEDAKRSSVLRLPLSLSIGISFHARYLPPPPSTASSSNSTSSATTASLTERQQQYYCRIFISQFVSNLSETTSEDGQIILAETVLELRKLEKLGNLPIRNDNDDSITRKGIYGDGILVLEVEYLRELEKLSSGNNGLHTSSTTATATSVSSSDTIKTALLYRIRARVREKGLRAAASNMWDVDAVLNIEKALQLQAGIATVGVVGSGMCRDRDWEVGRHVTTTAFSLTLHSLDFNGKIVAATVALLPSVSDYLRARRPDIAEKLSELVSALGLWMSLRIRVDFPVVLAVVFDADSLKSYHRLFSLLFKVRLVMHMVERLWKSTSTSTSTSSTKDNIKATSLQDRFPIQHFHSRLYFHLRQSILFFIGNLLYYLQVDVIDSEFSKLLKILENVFDLQTILKGHREFLANNLNLGMIENTLVQEGIDRILQICLRFVALCWLPLNEEEQEVEMKEKYMFIDSDIFTKELEAIRKDFYTQTSYLFQIMRKVENRGFLFRLDFNGYFSSLNI